MPSLRNRFRPVALAAAAGLAVLGGLEGPAAPARRTAYLLLHDWFGTSPVSSPSFIRAHRERLDSLPFDGIVVYVRNADLSVNVSARVMGREELTPREVESTLAPLKGLSFRRLTRNFAAVLGGRPPDFMDDWSVPVRNFALLAKAAREAGLKGIYFDNENYHAPWGDHPAGVRHPKIPLADYQKQARIRGREVMEAMVRQFPDIVVLALHGPYLSEPRAPAPLFPQWQSRNELLGPFFAGFVEGAGDRATVVDGGELYHLRTEREFQESYEWRKSDFPSDRVDSAFLPPNVRGLWSRRVRFGFGVYDRPFKGHRMDPDILAATLSHALRQSDSYVWLYVEGPSFLSPPEQGGASQEWIDAVRRGRESASR